VGSIVATFAAFVQEKSIFSSIPMAARRLLLASLVLSCSLLPCYGAVLFSSLQKTLAVTASPTSGQGNATRRTVFFFALSDLQLLSSHSPSSFSV